MMSAQFNFSSPYPTVTTIRWPLNELEEVSLTVDTHTSNMTLFQQSSPKLSLSPCKTGFRRSSSGFRCNSCQRRFHSIGNLSNHQQLYQH
ncbi:hypothetical protein BCR42DRAFT_419297 [Absidia repens]|uniref:C2H2-type domain-containing protein n=1 Tax=Absidia repens TaxID=90262 RepID=A0A1X2IB90_9FUNG|nr:hypothetical protein BCR42DRAFT_419297 [Absidia repens]